jgi:glycosyltransferase involved in cell wall biosynthesis
MIVYIQTISGAADMGNNAEGAIVEHLESSSPTSLVSICIPLYNHQKYITTLLDSIVEDPYPHKEIVVIDDGSSDDSYNTICAWLNEVKPGFPCTFLRQENAGVAVTLNRLFEKAKGDFCIPIASDDVLVPGGIGLRVNYLREHPHLIAVFGDARVIGADGEHLMESGLADLYHANKRRYLNPDSLLFQIVVKWSVPGPVLMVRRESIILFGGISTNLKLEDYDLYVRLADAGKLGFIDKIIAMYRIHETNTSRSVKAGRSIRREIIKTCFVNFKKSTNITKLYLGARIGITLMRWVNWELAYLLGKCNVKKIF